MNDAISMEVMKTMRPNDGYDDLLCCVTNDFDDSTKDGQPLFRTDVGNLYDTFLNNLPADARQHYNCNACRHFVNRYGSLVKIMDGGYLEPVLWKTAPAFFRKAVNMMHNRVRNARITGVFVSDIATLGYPITGSWKHIAAVMPVSMLNTNRLKNAHQIACEKHEDYKMLSHAVHHYSRQCVESAVNLLRSNTLYRSEAVLGVAEWLLGVYTDLGNTNDMRLRENILWQKSATAPVGFCHVSSTMIGTLLDDIKTGFPLDVVRRRFDEKMNPLKYQRPQSAPATGNVAQAEKIVEKLGIENSLKRRYARLDEIAAIWRPVPERETSTSACVFAGVVTKKEAKKHTRTYTPATTMTWEKFRRTILPIARKIEFFTRNTSDNYGAMLTAVDPSAPPILQWDTPESRNPVSWYVYSRGSYPSKWNLKPSSWVNVTAIVLQPSMWHGHYAKLGESVFFLLEGAKDQNYRHVSAGLFPEILKPELHEVRKTIEAYSKINHPAGIEQASAAGIRLQGGARNSWNALFRVTTEVGVTEYLLDRWD